MSECYIILGTVRSGTTATAGVLHELGVCMYENQIESEISNQFHPVGSVMDVDLHKGFMLHSFHHIIAERCHKYRKWGIKDHYVMMVWDDLMDSLKNETVKLIHCARDPEVSKTSFNSLRPICDNDFSNHLTQVEDIINKFKGEILTIQFNTLLAGEETEKLAAFVGVVPRKIEFIRKDVSKFT